MRKFSSGSVPGSQWVYINLSSIAKQQLPLVATDFGRVTWLFRATTFVLEPNTFVVLHALVYFST